jgi:cytochrome c oxidase assembly protein subunit 11
MKSRSNSVVAGVLAAVVVGMVGLSFAAIPLYRVFCQATGYGGTPKIGPAASPGETADMITVRFNADTYPDLPWHFAPVQGQVRVHLGGDQLAFYEARNESSAPVTGVATYTVTPDKAAKYFHKTACFCFNEQTLAPNQDMQFPLSFWVDPAIATDPATADVQTVTLSYTFFRSLDDAARSGALAKAGPHAGPISQQALSRLEATHP